MARKKNRDVTTEVLKEDEVGGGNRSNVGVKSRSVGPRANTTESGSVDSKSRANKSGAALGGAAVYSAAKGGNDVPAIEMKAPMETEVADGAVGIQTPKLTKTENPADGAALYHAEPYVTEDAASANGVDKREKNVAENHVAKGIAQETQPTVASGIGQNQDSNASEKKDDSASSTSTKEVLNALTASEQASANISSKADAEKQLADAHYSESEAVLDAYAQLEEYLNSKPDEYTSSYQEQIDGLLGQILNREDFAYDFDADPLYQQYKNQYEHSAQLAMQDTMAQAQAATGGYGSSYATQAASGAYQNEINQLTDLMPELYQMAYGIYQDKGEGMRDDLSVLSEQEKQAQSHYQDIVKNYYTGLDAATETAENAYAKDYAQYQDSLGYLQELLDYYAGQEQQSFENAQAQREYELAFKEYEESVRQWEAELANKKNQWQTELANEHNQWQSEFTSDQNQWWVEFDAVQKKAASAGAASTGSGSGNGSSASKSQSNFHMSDHAQDIKTSLTHEMRVYEAEGAKAADIEDAAKDILEVYYRTKHLTKAEANSIGAAYGVSF